MKGLKKPSFTQVEVSPANYTICATPTKFRSWHCLFSALKGTTFQVFCWWLTTWIAGWSSFRRTTMHQPGNFPFHGNISLAIRHPYLCTDISSSCNRLSSLSSYRFCPWWCIVNDLFHFRNRTLQPWTINFNRLLRRKAFQFATVTTIISRHNLYIGGDACRNIYRFADFSPLVTSTHSLLEIRYGCR